MGQVQKDFRTVPLPPIGEFATPSLSQTGQKKRDINKIIQDYHVDEYEVTSKVTRVIPTDPQTDHRHPSEYIFEEQRAGLHYASQMGEKDVLIFNLPKTFTKEDVLELCNVKGVKVITISLQKSFNEQSIACAKVTVHSQPQVKVLQQTLHNKWIEDKKVKTLNKKESEKETFNKRTLIVTNIPTHFKSENLVKLFDSYGNIVGIEMLFEDVKVNEFMKNKSDAFTKIKDEKIQHELNRSQQIIKDSIQTDQEYQQFLKSHLGKDEIERVLQNQGYTGDKNVPHEEQMSILDSQITLSLHNMITQIQKESADITSSKHLLLKLKRNLESDIPSLDTSSSNKDAFTKIDNEREAILRLVQYVNRNREQVDDDVLSQLNEKINFNTLGSSQDPLQRLENLTRLELAEAYDSLYNILVGREELLKKRFSEQYRHYGLEERTLFGKRDFTRENELVKNPYDLFNGTLHPEDYISVTEQIHDTIHTKNLTAEQKLYFLVSGENQNPFTKYNFDEEHFDTSINPYLAENRIYPIQDPSMSVSENRFHNMNHPLRPTAQSIADQTIKEFREDYDIPFDELYHKEKKLIDNVIKAYQALQDRQSRLPNPLGERNIIESGDVPESVLVNAGLKNETQFVRDQRKANEQILKKSLDGDSANGDGYQYLMQHQDEIDQQYDNGQITKADYEKYKIADNRLIDAMPMGNLDHKDLDSTYVINQMRNDTKIVDQIERLRAAKSQLDEFEQNIDQDLPKSKRMEEFRKMARDYIENAFGNSREQIQRTAQEEEELNEKIRLLQKQNPDIDFTQLFDNERNEQIRKNQHKKAFQSYKTFQFLKHGVEFQTKRKQEMAERQLQKEQAAKPKDAYQYPPLEKTIAQFVSKNGNFGILNGVESYTKSGRKFNYDEKDFIESYFGKDGLRRLGFDSTVDKNRSSLFGFNETWKNRFPVEKYLIAPKLEEYKERLNSIAGRDTEDLTRLNDVELHMIHDRYDSTNPNHVTLVDHEHPTQPDRSFMTDLEQKFKAYSQRRAKIAVQEEAVPTIGHIDLKMIKKVVEEEYFPKPEKKPVGVPVQDTKATEKFEPTYTHEGKKKPIQPKQEEEVETSEDEYINDERLYQASDVKEPVQSYNDPMQRRANARMIYKYTDQVTNNPDYDDEKDGNKSIQTLELIAEENKMKTDDLLDKLKGLGPLDFQGQGDGKFLNKQVAGSMKSDFDIQSRERKQSKTLRDFAEDSLSEREDEDIFKHYMSKMEEAKKQKAQEKLNLDKQEQLIQEQTKKIDEMFPEIPRFEGFFKSQSEGRHPFDQEKFEMPEETEQDKQKRQETDEFLEELYQRELHGRLLGGTLTPRQFAIMYGATADEKIKMKLQESYDEQSQPERRQQAALLLELKEQMRRKKVLSGEWTEEESNKKLHELLQQHFNTLAQYKDPVQEARDSLQKELQLKNILVHQKLQEKEYYFDEGLGVSVNDHIKKLQKDFPDLEVSVRRDREGYPVIKTTYKPKFKYNLDTFLNFDAKKEHEHLKESTEIILSTMLPFGKGVKDISQLSKEQLQQSLQSLMPYNLNNQDRFEYDAATQYRLNKLVDERFDGKYRNDPDSFAQALVQFNETATYDKTRKISGSNRIAKPQINYQEAFNEIDQELDTFQTEIMQQIMMRVKDHVYGTKRKQTDFVKPRASEASMFASQLQHHENVASNLQEDADNLEQEPGFDKESYKQLKAEIKRRREAKERLLQQGFPELKPYATF